MGSTAWDDVRLLRPEDDGDGSGGAAVLVDQSVEHVNAFNRPTVEGRFDECQPALRCGRCRSRLRCGPAVLEWRRYSINTRCSWRWVQISIQSKHSVRTVSTHRSAYALARGARDAIFTTSMPAAANTASNPGVNLVSRSQIRNRNRCADRPSPSTAGHRGWRWCVLL